MTASQPLEFLSLQFAFDAFRNNTGIERPRQCQDALDDRRTFGKQQTPDERPIDFQCVDRKLVQMTERRIPGDKVIEVDLDSKVSQVAQCFRRHSRATHQSGLGDLETKIRWGQTRSLHRL